MDETGAAAVAENSEQAAPAEAMAVEPINGPESDTELAAAVELNQAVTSCVNLTDSLRRIIAQQERVSAARGEWEELKKEASAAKKKYETEVNRLEKAIAEEKEPSLFSAGTVSGMSAPAVAPAPTPAPEPEAWRSVRLDTLDLPARVLTALAEASPPIVTIGDHADYCKPRENGYCPRLTDIKGIGKGAVDKIDDALESFWSTYRAAADVPAVPVVDVNSEPEPEAEAGEDPPVGDTTKEAADWPAIDSVM